MPHARFRRLPPERQREILDIAAKEIAANGYEGTSLNRILQRAGLSKGAAYYLFDGKDDLVATMFADTWSRLMGREALDIAKLTAETFWPDLIRYSQQLMASARDDPWALSAAKAIWSLPAGARTSGTLGQTFKVMVDWLLQLLRRGRELGVVRSDLPEGMQLAMVMAMDEAADRWLLEHGDSLDPAELVRLSGVPLEMWERMLTPVEGRLA